MNQKDISRGKDNEISKLSEINDIQTTFDKAIEYINEELFKQ